MRIPHASPLVTVRSTTPGLALAQGTEIAAATIRDVNATTFEATIQLSGSLATYLSGVPISMSIPISMVRSGARCVVAFFNPTDPSDACILAVFGRPPYRDDPGNYVVLNSTPLNVGQLCGSETFYLDVTDLNAGVLS